MRLVRLALRELDHGDLGQRFNGSWLPAERFLEVGQGFGVILLHEGHETETVGANWLIGKGLRDGFEDLFALGYVPFPEIGVPQNDGGWYITWIQLYSCLSLFDGQVG